MSQKEIARIPISKETRERLKEGKSEFEMSYDGYIRFILENGS